MISFGSSMRKSSGLCSAWTVAACGLLHAAMTADCSGQANALCLVSASLSCCGLCPLGHLQPDSGCTSLCQGIAFLGCSLLPMRSSMSQVNQHAEGYVCLLGNGCRPLHDADQLLLAIGWASPAMADFI